MRLVNGNPAQALALADRSIQFGDGVFRTVKCRAGHLAFWARHYRKLCADCAVLGIAAPAETQLLDEIRQLLAQTGWPDAVFKIIVTRGESVRGYAAVADIVPNRIVQIAPRHAYPAQGYEQGVTVRLCRMRASWQPALAGVKHLNRLENVMARREWSDPAILEGLLLDRDGNVLEGVMSNVLALSDGKLVTPRLDTGGVTGVMREVALDAARRLHLPVAEQALALETLWAADRVWISNSLLGLMPVVSLDGHFWQVEKLHPLTREVVQMEREEWQCV
ncbi:MAG: aminodeoxychorismate lyase [Formivibrio sp.]|nr:aminodeoxychorismate lyase [Formivibrio sp.]